MDDQRRVFSEVIKRQMAILGPDITFAKVKNVPGIQIDAAGNVTALNGDSKVLLQQLINQFMELSGLIVKKTMESILATNGMPSVLASPIPSAPVEAVKPMNATVEVPDTNNRMASANRDLEDLNKMLDNLGNSK